MGYLFALLCIGLMILSLFILILGLPGNWIILILALLWSLISGAGFGWKFFMLLAGLAALGELLEFTAGYYGSKYFGGTKSGSIGGIIGALLLGILCTPILFGLGALPGALAGGFLGSFAVEKYHGMQTGKAALAAVGTMLGRFGGFLAKLGIGIAMIGLSAPRIWQSLEGLPAPEPSAPHEIIVTLLSWL